MTRDDIVRANPSVSFEPAFDDTLFGHCVQRMHGTQDDGTHVQVVWRGTDAIWTTAAELSAEVLRKLTA